MDDWLLLYPPQVEHMWFQRKQVEASSCKHDCALYGRMGIVTLKPSVRLWLFENGIEEEINHIRHV